MLVKQENDCRVKKIKILVARIQHKIDRAYNWRIINNVAESVQCK